MTRCPFSIDEPSKVSINRDGPEVRKGDLAGTGQTAGSHTVAVLQTSQQDDFLIEYTMD